jgi:predicted RNA-binding Zn-ribbon protein involved in translation (DUF1610 family)
MAEIEVREAGVAVIHRCPRCGCHRTMAFYGTYCCERCGCWFVSDDVNHL